MESEATGRVVNMWGAIGNYIGMMSMAMPVGLWILKMSRGENDRLLTFVETAAIMEFVVFMLAYWAVRIWTVNLKESSRKKTRFFYWALLFMCSVSLAAIVIPLSGMLLTSKMTVEGFGRYLGRDSPLAALIYIVVSSLGLLPRPLRINRKVEVPIHIAVQAALVVSVVATHICGWREVVPWAVVGCGAVLSVFSLLKDLFLSRRWRVWKKYRREYDWIPFVTVLICMIIVPLDMATFKNSKRETEPILLSTLETPCW